MWSPSPAEWAALEPLVDQLLALPPGERPSFVDRHFGATPELRAWIGRLVAGAEDESLLSGLDPSVVAEALSGDEGTSIGGEVPELYARFGPYRTVREIGRGGMGVVYEAERADGQFAQRVALKVVGHGFDSDDTRRRFLAERQILARLEHPNVARLVDGGIREDGVPWFAMDFVEGERIDEWCDRRRLDLAGRLRLFLAVCDAVQAAHQRLVIHRDLKPSNIYVTPDGSVRLLDFGIAKLIDGSTTGPDDATRAGHRLFTPDFAAPEQWRGEAATTASDCYALGVVLYELLSGARPHDLRRHPEPEWVRVVFEHQVAPPSAVVSEAAAAARGVTVDRLRRSLRGDLNTIALTALRVEPERRYQTARELGDDVRRHLDGLPISARADTWRYRAGKFVRRNRLRVAAAALLSLSLAAGAVGVVWQARRAERAAQEAMAVSDFLTGMFLQASPLQARGDSLTAGEMLQRAAASIDSAFADRPALRVRLLVTVAQINRDLGAVERADTLARRALLVADSAAGPESLASIGALAMLADVTRARGDYAGADTLMSLALARGRAAGAPDTGLARLLDGRGSILYRLQRFAPAESAHRQALIAGARLGPAFLGATLNNLGLVLDDAGREQEADSAYRAALAVFRDASLTDHPDYVLALGNRASLLDERWELDSAEVLKEEVLARMRRFYPEGHDRVVIALNNLAFGRLLAGDWVRAERGFAEATAMVERLHGAGYPFALVTRNNQGRALLLGGRAAEAESTFRAVLASVQRSLGPDHPYVTMARLFLGRALGAQGRAAEALAQLEAASSLAERVLPPTHPRLADLKVARGEVLLGAGRVREAEPLLRAALEWRRAHLTPRDPETAAAAALLARALAGLSERGDRSAAALEQEAQALLAEAVERYRRTGLRPEQQREAEAALARWRAGGRGPPPNPAVHN